MKTSTKLLLIGIFCMFSGMVSVQAQAPATVTVTTSGGPATLPQDVFPTVDLVTKGTTVPYLVYPDIALNPTWVAGADAKNTTGIVSTWTWTISGTIGTTASTIHYMELPITGAVGTAGTITVQEKSAATCTGSNSVMNLKVVAAPNVTSGAVAATSICQSGTNGSLGVAFPQYSAVAVIDASVTTPTVMVKATLTFTPLSGPATDLFVDKVLNVDAVGNISNTDLGTALGVGVFNSWGTYNLKITAVSDKISRKDVTAAKGYFTLTTPTTAVFSLFKAPTTGPIYHLPN